MNGHAATQEVDGHHQQSLLGITSDHDALYVRKRSTRDAHALPSAQIGVRHHRGPTRDDLPDRFDLGVRDDGELVPAVAENAHQPARLAEREIAGLVDGMTKEHVATEERYAHEASGTATPAPRLNRRQEQGK